MSKEKELYLTEEGLEKIKEEQIWTIKTIGTN